jgi:hypothetical protein
VTGNIETPWAGRAKEYAWNLMLPFAPRGITPSDIDFVYECGGHFLLCEMKTADTVIPRGQELMLERLLRRLSSRSVLAVVRHPPAERIVLPTDVDSFDTWRWLDGGVLKRRPYAGEDFPLWVARWFEHADAP